MFVWHGGWSFFFKSCSFFFCFFVLEIQWLLWGMLAVAVVFLVVANVVAVVVVVVVDNDHGHKRFE